MNIIKTLISKFKERKKKSIEEKIKYLDDLYNEVLESQLSQERLIDKGASKSSLSNGGYGDLDRALGRSIAATARLIYGSESRLEIKKRTLECIDKVESEVGREIADKAKVIRMIRDI